MIFRGCGCVWNCMLPIGRQCASGLSLLLSAMRFFTSSAAHDWMGNPSGNPRPTLANVATGGVPGGGGGGGGAGAPPWPRCPAGTLTFSQIPDKSGFPSAAFGAGAFMLGFPSDDFG